MATEKKQRKSPTKSCPKCETVVHVAVKTCPKCGHEFIAKEKKEVKIKKQKVNQPTFVEERPSFDELFELMAEVNELRSMVISLAEGNDIVQRCSDLFSQAERVLVLVEDTVTIEEIS